METVKTTDEACTVCGCYKLCGRDECRVAFTRKHGPRECAVLAKDTAKTCAASVRETVRQAAQLLDAPGAVSSVNAALCASRVDDEADEIVADIDMALSILYPTLPAKDRALADDLRDALLRLSCNAYGIFGPGWRDVAILACVSGAQIFNHSCFPNVVLDYVATLASAQRGELVVYYRTLRPVAKGEQLYVSYAVCRESRNQRQLYLQRTTCFTCACSRCEGEMFDDPIAPFLCEKEGCSLTFELPGSSEDGKRRCTLCGLVQLPPLSEQDLESECKGDRDSGVEEV